MPYLVEVMEVCTVTIDNDNIESLSIYSMAVSIA